MPGLQVLEEPQCRIRIDPNLVDKFKRLPGGVNEVGTKISRDIGLRYEYNKSTGAFDILGPDTEILSLAIETLRFWIDEDVYPRSGITCQVGYPNKGIVFWRFHGDYARKFDHLFDNEIENLKLIPTINVKAVPNKKNPEFIEIYCNFNTYHRVKDEIMRISSELTKICQDDFFVPIADFHKARKFAREKAKDKSILFALKEYEESDKFRVWIFARDYADIIKARKEWVNHVGKIARDTAFEERVKRDRFQGIVHDESSVNSAHFFGHESSKESDLVSHKRHLDPRRTNTIDLRTNKVKLQRKPSQTKNLSKDKIQLKSVGSTYDNPNYPRPPHMFFPVQKDFEIGPSNEFDEPVEQKDNPWLDPLLLSNGNVGETNHSSHVANAKWITEPTDRLYQAKKPNRPGELNRMYMHHQVHQEYSDEPKTELTLVKHPDTNLINENIVTLRKSQIITSVNDHRFAPRREVQQNTTPRNNIGRRPAQQIGYVRQLPSLHSVKQMKQREAQSNIRYHINVNGLDIFMYRHNVVKLNNVDALVNVVDTSMQEGGYIARDMSVAAGRQVDDEIKVFLFNNGPLKVAETCVTSAGKIPCLGIINVAGPRWKDYETVEEKCAIDLHTAIYNTLKTAEKHKYRKIGLPTICGETYFGIPKEIVAEVHVKALVDYSLGMGPLYPVLEIHLVDLNVDMLFAIKQAYEDWASSPGFVDMAEKFKTATGNIPNPIEELSQRAESAVSLKGVPSHRSKNVVTFTEQSYTKDGHQMWSFDILKKLTVHVYMGSVVKLDNIQAIVCGVDRKMKGSLAKIIRAYGGYPYELALGQARGQRSLVEGEVVVCTAGSLPVQWVFHSVILQPMRKASLKNLSRLDSIYTQILHAADKLDITSLAMPLIGAGRFREKFEIEQCSLQLVDNIIELCLSAREELKLKEIHLVNVSELNTQYLCQALRTRAHTKLRVENEKHRPTRQVMFSNHEKNNYSEEHYRRRSKVKTQNHTESPKRISPIQKRHGRILIDKNALLEEQFKRKIRDMEEEKKAALRKQQEISDEPEVIAYNPRKVNNWLQNMNGVSRNQDDRFKENYLYGALPNGFRHHERRSSQQGNEDLHKNPIPVKSRAESYHTYNKYDQMASHREKWDLVRQRSRSTDALPRKKENKHNKEDQYTHRSSKDLQEFNDGKQMFPDIYSDNMHSYESYNIANNNNRATRFYSEYERSSQRPVDTYETLVTEREALHSDYQLFKDRDESRFRDHRNMLVNDNTHERIRRSRIDRQRRSGVKDINEEVDRILKERNNDEIFGDHTKADKQYEQEKTYKEKEKDEMRQIHKYWAINEAFEKDLQTGTKDSPKTTFDSDERMNQTKHEITAEDKEGIELIENKRVNENPVEKKGNNAKENKEAKKTRIKYENRVYIDSSKQKSRTKGSKKSKKHTSKTSSATLAKSVKQDSIQDTDIFVTDGKTDITTTSSGAYSPMKRYDSQVEKRYLQFDKYTDSDVYPRTPEPSLTQDNLKRKHKFEENKQRRSLKSNEDRHYNEQDRGNKTKYNNDQDEIITDNSKSVKSFSSRPTIDSRTVKFPNKEGESTGKTFSVLAGDVGMMEQFQNISEGLRSYNVSVKVV